MKLHRLNKEAFFGFKLILKGLEVYLNPLLLSILINKNSRS